MRRIKTNTMKISAAAWVLLQFASNLAYADDVTIHLSKTAAVSRKTVRYQCDAQAAKIGLPAGSFTVEYINGGGNSLVVVPISGNPLIFSNVMAASGARYAAQQFIWWEAKGAATLYSDWIGGKMQSVCQPVPWN